MNTTSVLSLFPETKASVKSFVERIKSEVLSGEKDPLEFSVIFKSLEEIVKELRSDKDIKETILDEAAKYGNKTFEAKGAKFTIRDSARYDYSSDEKWRELNAEVTKLKEKIKKREEMLKSLTDEVADPETGEIIYPAVKYSTTSVSVTLK